MALTKRRAPPIAELIKKAIALTRAEERANTECNRAWERADRATRAANKAWNAVEAAKQLQEK